MKKETKKLNKLIAKVEGKINQLTKKIDKIELKFDTPTDAMLALSTLPGCYKSAKADYLRIKYKTAMDEKSMLQDLLKSLIAITNGEARPDPIEDTYEPHIVRISDGITLEPVVETEETERWDT